MMWTCTQCGDAHNDERHWWLGRRGTQPQLPLIDRDTGLPYCSVDCAREALRPEVTPAERAAVDMHLAAVRGR